MCLLSLLISSSSRHKALLLYAHIFSLRELQKILQDCFRCPSASSTLLSVFETHGKCHGLAVHFRLSRMQATASAVCGFGRIASLFPMKSSRSHPKHLQRSSVKPREAFCAKDDSPAS